VRVFKPRRANGKSGEEKKNWWGKKKNDMGSLRTRMGGERRRKGQFSREGKMGAPEEREMKIQGQNRRKKECRKKKHRRTYEDQKTKQKKGEKGGSKIERVLDFLKKGRDLFHGLSDLDDEGAPKFKREEKDTTAGKDLTLRKKSGKGLRKKGRRPPLNPRHITRKT